MPSQNKSIWIMMVLVAAGGIILFLSLKQHNPSSNKVEMQEILNTKSFPETINNQQVDKDPVPSPAIVTSPEHGQEAGFAVQVYSFRDEKRSDAALTNLKNAGYDAFVQISDLGEKGTWYRVRIGGLKDEAQAKSLLETVRKNFNSGFIVKPKK